MDETQPPAPEITATQRQEQPTAMVREKVPMAELSDFFGRAFSSVMAAVQERGLQPAGPPFGMYHGMPTDVVDVEAGFPLTAPFAAGEDGGMTIDGGHGQSAVTAGTLPAGPAYVAMHTGPYDSLQRTYQALVERMQADGVAPADLMWEQYLTDPGEEPDQSKWQTQVIWPAA